MNAKDFGMAVRYWDATLSNLAIPEIYHEPLMEWLKDPKFMLVLSGTPGTGKTHICAAILNDKWNRQEVRYFRDDLLYIEAKKALSHNWDGSEVMTEKCSSRYLIIDDFGVGETTPYKLECNERMIDYRYSLAEKGATIITTNLSVKEVKEKYSERISSRLFAKDNTSLFLEGYDLRR